MLKDMVADIKLNKGVSPVGSAAKFYRVKNKDVAYQIAKQNLSKSYFQEALFEELRREKVLGKSENLLNRLSDGLNAVDSDGNPDIMARLAYIKEINKVCGAYKSKGKVLADYPNNDLNGSELDNKIRRLEEELKSDGASGGVI